MSDVDLTSPQEDANQLPMKKRVKVDKPPQDERLQYFFKVDGQEKKIPYPNLDFDKVMAEIKKPFDQTLLCIYYVFFEIAVGTICALLAILVFDWEYYSILFTLGLMIFVGLFLYCYYNYSKKEHESDVERNKDQILPLADQIIDNFYVITGNQAANVYEGSSLESRDALQLIQKESFRDPYFQQLLIDDMEYSKPKFNSENEHDYRLFLWHCFDAYLLIVLSAEGKDYQSGGLVHMSRVTIKQQDVLQHIHRICNINAYKQRAISFNEILYAFNKAGLQNIAKLAEIRKRLLNGIRFHKTYTDESEYEDVDVTIEAEPAETAEPEAIEEISPEEIEIIDPDFEKAIQHINDRGSDWDLVVSNDDVTAYRRPFPGQPIMNLNMSAIIPNVKGKEIIQMLCDPTIRCQWDDMFRNPKIVEGSFAEGELVVYSTVKPPIFIIAERENCVKTKIKVGYPKPNCITTYGVSVDHPNSPQAHLRTHLQYFCLMVEDSNLSGVDSVIMKWTFHNNMMGSIPAAVLGKMAPKMPPKMIGNLKKFTPIMRSKGLLTYANTTEP